MSNISGNFDTGSREERIVAYYLRLNKEKDFTVSKFGEAIDSKKAKPIMTNAVSSGDIYVTFPDKRYCLIEVKEESESRFSKYGEYGIDMISMFHFKKGVDRKKWIRPLKE